MKSKRCERAGCNRYALRSGTCKPHHYEGVRVLSDPLGALIEAVATG